MRIVCVKVVVIEGRYVKYVIRSSQTKVKICKPRAAMYVHRRESVDTLVNRCV